MSENTVHNACSSGTGTMTRRHLPTPKNDLSDAEYETLYQSHFAIHQKAFRAAFDFLKAAYPPGTGAEYWSKTNATAISVMAQMADNPLGQRLIEAVYTYLNDTRAGWDKERREGQT